MSWKAQAWAAEQRTGGASTKLVLMIYASFANELGLAYPSNPTVSAISELDPKTVRAAIDKLEQLGLLVDTGRRAGRTRQVKIYRLEMESLPEAVGLATHAPGATPDAAIAAAGAPVVARPPKPAPLRGRAKATVFSAKAPKNGGQNLLGTLPPEDADASSAPKGARRDRGLHIDSSWAPPPIDDLPDEARRVAAQWPGGAYAREAEAFRSYWLGEGRSGARKRDWIATWCARIIAIGGKPMRDAKAGVSGGHAGSATSGRVIPDVERAEMHDRIADGMAKRGLSIDAQDQRAMAARIRARLGTEDSRAAAAG